MLIAGPAGSGKSAVGTPSRLCRRTLPRSGFRVESSLGHTASTPRTCRAKLPSQRRHPSSAIVLRRAARSSLSSVERLLRRTDCNASDVAIAPCCNSDRSHVPATYFRRRILCASLQPPGSRMRRHPGAAAEMILTSRSWRPRTRHFFIPLKRTRRGTTSSAIRSSSTRREIGMVDWPTL